MEIKPDLYLDLKKIFEKNIGFLKKVLAFYFAIPYNHKRRKKLRTHPINAEK